MVTKRYIKSRNVAKVSFEIPKSQLPEGLTVDAVGLAGDFNEWDAAVTPMVRTKGGAYRATVELDPGQEYQFRYLVNGEHWYNDWDADGYIPGGLGPDNCVVVTPSGPEPN
jgi:hypothetical protein